jgi:hypothetical protein
MKASAPDRRKRAMATSPDMRYVAPMSEITTQTDRDERGRYKTGNIGGGRPKGARSKLGEAYVADLRDCWETHGAVALARCATEEPAQFVRVVASLMPKDINLNVAIDAVAFADRFNMACELLGNEAPRQVRKPLPGQRVVIEHDNVG